MRKTAKSYESPSYRLLLKWVNHYNILATKNGDPEVRLQLFTLDPEGKNSFKLLLSDRYARYAAFLTQSNYVEEAAKEMIYNLISQGIFNAPKSIYD